MELFFSLLLFSSLLTFLLSFFPSFLSFLLLLLLLLLFLVLLLLLILPLLLLLLLLSLSLSLSSQLFFGNLWLNGSNIVKKKWIFSITNATGTHLFHKADTRTNEDFTKCANLVSPWTYPLPPPSRIQVTPSGSSGRTPVIKYLY